MKALTENDPQDPVFITPEKMRRIKKICSRRKGSRTDDAVAEDLKDFIGSDLRNNLLGIPPVGKWTNVPLKERQQRYYEFEHFGISGSSLRRACKEEGISRGRFILLNEVLDLYLEAYEFSPAADPVLPLATYTATSTFSSKTISELSHRASGLCSSPHCWQTTSGPSGSNPTKAHHLGIACLIHGLQPGDARYDPAKKPAPDDIENGIWLCINHAQLVNEHEGDYTAETLIAWKQTHEELMQACLEGRKRITISLNTQEEDPVAAAAIIAFFDQQQVLYARRGTIPNENIILAVQDIGSWLLEQAASILFDRRLEQLLTAIDRSCDAFLHITRHDTPAIHEYALAALKKVIGMVLDEMATHYKIALPANLRTITPHNDPLD